MTIGISELQALSLLDKLIVNTSLKNSSTAQRPELWLQNTTGCATFSVHGYILTRECQKRNWIWIYSWFVMELYFDT